MEKATRLSDLVALLVYMEIKKRKKNYVKARISKPKSSTPFLPQKPDALLIVERKEEKSKEEYPDSNPI